MHRRTTSRLFLLALACAALTGCQPRPEKVAWEFHRALLMRDGEKALSLLSQKTRDELTRRAHQASVASGGALPDKAAAMICQGDLSLYRSRDLAGRDVVKVEPIQLPEGARRAEVEVTLAGVPYLTLLVREEGGWRVELMAGAGDSGSGAHVETQPAG